MEQKQSLDHAVPAADNDREQREAFYVAAIGGSGDWKTCSEREDRKTQ